MSVSVLSKILSHDGVVGVTSDSMPYCPLLAMPMVSRSYTEVASCRLALRASTWSGIRLITASPLVYRDRGRDQGEIRKSEEHTDVKKSEIKTNI